MSPEGRHQKNGAHQHIVLRGNLPVLKSKIETNGPRNVVAFKVPIIVLSTTSSWPVVNGERASGIPNIPSARMASAPGGFMERGQLAQGRFCNPRLRATLPGDRLAREIASSLD
jgi:hypothetical protein